MKFIGLNDSDTGIRTVGQEVTVSATHAAVLFLLDESGSMSGNNIISLNDAINRFPGDVSANNNFAKTNIEIAVMAFSSSVRLVSDWRPLANYTPVSLSADGGTNLGSALDSAITKAKEKLDNNLFKMVHIVLISDGCGGSVTAAAREIEKMKKDGTLVFWMLGVPGYDRRTALKLTGGERLYELKHGKQFDYTDFITMLASAIIKIQNESVPPTLQPIPEVKTIGFNQSGNNQFGAGNSNNGTSGSGSFGSGFFGKGTSGGKLGK